MRLIVLSGNTEDIVSIWSLSRNLADRFNLSLRRLIPGAGVALRLETPTTNPDSNSVWIGGWARDLDDSYFNHFRGFSAPSRGFNSPHSRTSYVQDLAKNQHGKGAKVPKNLLIELLTSAWTGVFCTYFEKKKNRRRGYKTRFTRGLKQFNLLKISGWKEPTRKRWKGTENLKIELLISARTGVFCTYFGEKTGVGDIKQDLQGSKAIYPVRNLRVEYGVYFFPQPILFLENLKETYSFCGVNVPLKEQSSHSLSQWSKYGN